MYQKIKYHVGNYLPALRSANYRLYFFGQGISLIGSWIGSIAQQWLIYPTLTQSKSLLGIVNAVNLLPTVVLVLIAGVIADRVNRRNTLIFIQSFFAVVSLSVGLLILAGKIQIWHVMVASLLSGIAFAFDMPIRNSLMLDLVDKKTYPSAISLQSGIFNIARAVGPATAGFLIVFFGIPIAYFVDSVTYLAVIGSIIVMKLAVPVVSHKHEPIIEGLVGGFAYLKQNKEIVALLLLLGFGTVFTWPINVLTPVFAHDIFKRGVIGFGLMQSAFGLGAVVGAFSFSKLFQKVADKFLLLATVISSIIILSFLFGLSPSFNFSLFIYVLFGLNAAILISLVNTLIQINAPSVLRGRLLSFYSLVLIGGMPFGSLYVSLLVELIGPRLTVISAAVLYMIACLLIFALTKDKLRQKLHLISKTNIQ